MKLPPGIELYRGLGGLMELPDSFYQVCSMIYSWFTSDLILAGRVDGAAELVRSQSGGNTERIGLSRADINGAARWGEGNVVVNGVEETVKDVTGSGGWDRACVRWEGLVGGRRLRKV
jgi:hypothetical protein